MGRLEQAVAENRKALEKKMEAYIETLKEGMAQAQKLIDNFTIDGSRITVDINPKFIGTQIADQLEEAVEMSNKQFARKNIKFSEIDIGNIIGISPEKIFGSYLRQLQDDFTADSDSARGIVDWFTSIMDRVEWAIDQRDPDKFIERVEDEFDDLKGISIYKYTDKISEGIYDVDDAISKLSQDLRNADFTKWLDFESYFESLKDRDSYTISVADLLKFDISDLNEEDLRRFINNVKELMWVEDVRSLPGRALDAYSDILSDESLSMIDTSIIDEKNRKIQELTENVADLESQIAELERYREFANRIKSEMEDVANGDKKLEDALSGMLSLINKQFDDLSPKLASIKKELEELFNKSKISSGTTAPLEQVESKLEEVEQQAKETSTAIENVIYHSGTISKLNKAETNGQFYGSNRGTGYFGTGHYFVDSSTKHEIMDGQFASKPFTSVDISKYDNLFKANTDDIAGKLHSFLERLTKYTQGNDTYNINELFSQFEDVFGKNVLSEEEFNKRLSELLDYMSKSSMYDRGDSVSTQFMKSLGYGGVDTRGTKYADTRYGTVIYDLKEESVLQANITDELQKQGDMLDKIAYKTGEVFDKSEDDRIQGILDKQAQEKAITDEYNKIFDSTALNKADEELLNAENRLKEINEIIYNCQHGIDNAESEVKQLNKELSDMGLEISDDMLQSQIEDHKKSYQERIDELTKEKGVLESQIPILQEKYDLESKLSGEAYEQAKNNVLGQPDKNGVSSGTTAPLQQVEEKLGEVEEKAEKAAVAVKNVFRAFNSEHGFVGDNGISWMTDTIENVLTYLNSSLTNKDSVGMYSIDPSKILSIDANGSTYEEIKYLGDGADEASKRIIYLDERITELNNNIHRTAEEERELSALELEYEGISHDSSNLYGTHNTEWIVETARELGIVAIQIQNVEDSYNGTSGKLSTTFAILDDNVKNTVKDVYELVAEFGDLSEKLDKNVFDSKEIFGDTSNLSNLLKTFKMGELDSLSKGQQITAKRIFNERWVQEELLPKYDPNSDTYWDDVAKAWQEHHRELISQMQSRISEIANELGVEQTTVAQSEKNIFKNLVFTSGVDSDDFDKYISKYIEQVGEGISALEAFNKVKQDIINENPIAAFSKYLQTNNIDTSKYSDIYVELAKGTLTYDEAIQKVINDQKQLPQLDTTPITTAVEQTTQSLWTMSETGQQVMSVMDTLFSSIREPMLPDLINASTTAFQLLGSSEQTAFEILGIGLQQTSQQLSQLPVLISAIQPEVNKIEQEVPLIQQITESMFRSFVENANSSIPYMATTFGLAVIEMEQQAERAKDIFRNMEFVIGVDGNVVDLDGGAYKELESQILSVKEANEVLNRSARETQEGIEGEGSEFGKAGEEALGLADKKTKAKKSNEDLKESADATADSVRNEGDAMDAAGNYITNGFSNADNILNLIRGRINNLANEGSGVESVVNGLTDAEQKLARAQEIARRTNHDFVDLAEYQRVVKELNSILTKLENRSVSGDGNYYQNMVHNMNDLGAAMDNYADNNNLIYVGTKKTNDIIGQQTRIYRNNRNEIVTITAKISDQDHAMRILSEDTKNGVSAQKTLMSAFGKSTKSIITALTSYNLLRTVLGKIRQSFTEGVNTLKEYDSALTTISYTMNMTSSQLDNLGDSAVQMAKDLSLSIDNAMKIYQIYANMKTNANEIAQTSRPTAILSNLTGIDASSAADEIQGVIAQFKDITADEASHIVDVYDYISSNIAVDYSKGIEGMAEAVQNVGNVADQAGLSFEQLSAIIAKTMEQTRQSGSTISNGLKTIMVRLSKASKFDDEIDNETISKAAASLHEIGIEVYNTDGEFREFDVIMKQLADQWDDLSDAQQSNISYQVAATRQTAIFKSILQNWTDSMQLATDATNAFGNAEANQAKYEESYVGKLQKLKTSMQMFWLDILNSDSFSRLLDFLQKIVDYLDEVAKRGDGIKLIVGSLISLIIGKTFISYLSTMASAYIQAAGAGATFADAIMGIQTGLTSMSSLIIQGISRLGPYALAIAAVGIAMYGCVKAFQHYNITVSEVNDQISKTTSRISEIKSEIEELESIGYKNSYEQQRLDGLREELAIQEDLLDIENRRRARELTGSKFTDWFDADNYATQLAKASGAQDRFNKIISTYYSLVMPSVGGIISIVDNWFGAESQSEILGGLTNSIDEYNKAVDETNKKRQTILNVQNNPDFDADYKKTFAEEMEDGVIEAVNKEYEARQKVLSSLIDAETQAASYKNTMTELSSLYDSGYIDKSTFDNLYNQYESLYNELHDVIVQTQKDFGMYDYSSEIEGVFAKVDFDGVKDKLIDLGKQGKLSVESLTSGFPELITLLEAAGVDAETLYNYIMNLADPQKAWRDSTKSDFVDDIYSGKNRTQYDDRGFYIHGNAETDATQLLQDAGLDINDENVLNAYLKIKGEYDTTSWEPKDWVQKIQNELDDNPVKVKLSRGDMIDQLDKLSDGFDVLADIYKDIEDGGDFDFEKLTKKKFSEAFDTAGLQEEYEEFRETVAKYPNDIGKCQDAFNKLTTAYLENQKALDGINRENAETTEAVLKTMGVSNAHVLVLQEMANAGIELTDVEQKELDAALALEEPKRKLAEEEAAAVVQKYNYVDATAEDIQALYDEAAATKYAGEAFVELAAKQVLINEKGLDLSSQITQLTNIATAAWGAAAGMAAISEMENGLANDASWAGSLESAWNYVYSKYSNIKLTVDGDYSGTKTPSSPSGSSSDKDKYVEQYEKEIKKLEELEEAGMITTKQKLDYQRGLYKKYFQDLSKYAGKFNEEQKKYVNAMIEYLEKVGSAVTTILDAQISKANRAKELATRPLQKQVKALDKQIEALDRQVELLEREQEEKTYAIDQQIKAKNKLKEAQEKELNRLEKINEERERDLQLQQALYSLERAENQKNKLVYDSENGFTYQADSDAISEARKNVEDAKFEEAKAQIQSIIDKIDEEVDALEKQKEAIEEYYEAQIRLLNKQKEALEDQKYDLEQQISAIEEYWDNIIEGLEDKKSKWEQLMEVKQIADAYKVLEEAGMDMGFTVEDILNDTGGAFDSFMQMYTSLLTDAGYSTEQLGSAFGSLNDIEMPTDNITSYVNATEEGFNKLKTAIEEYGTTLENAPDATKNITDALAKINPEEISTKASLVKTSAKELGSAIPEGIKEGLKTEDGKTAKDVIDEQTDQAVLGANRLGTELSGALDESAAKIKESVDEMIDPLNDLNSVFNGEIIDGPGAGKPGYSGGLIQSIDNFVKVLSSLNTEADLSNLVTQLNNLADAFGKIATNSQLINLGAQDAGIIGQFIQLRDIIKEVAALINGMPADGSSIQAAIDALNLISLGGDSEDGGIIGQFTKLRDAVQEVTTAIGLGGEVDEEGARQTRTNGAQGDTGESEGEGGLVQALETMQQTGVDATDALIGEEETSGFKGVDSWVQHSAEHIGVTSEPKDGDGDGTLTGNLSAFNKLSTTVMPEINTLFSELASSLGTAASSITTLYEYMKKMGGAGVKFNLGNLTGGIEFTAPAEASGNAYVWGKQEHQKNPRDLGAGSTLVGELGEELVVDPKAGTWRTVGSTGAEFANIPKNSIVFNHLKKVALRGDTYCKIYLIAGKPLEAI